MFENDQHEAYEPIEYLYHGTSSQWIPEICRSGYLLEPYVTDDFDIAYLYARWACQNYAGEETVFRMVPGKHQLMPEDRNQYQWHIHFLHLQPGSVLEPDKVSAFRELLEDEVEITGTIGLRLIRSARVQGNVPLDDLELEVGRWGSLTTGDPELKAWGMTGVSAASGLAPVGALAGGAA